MLDIQFGLLIFVLGFFITAILTKNWIKVAKKVGLVGKDMNKYSRPKVAESGGVTVIVGISITILLYIFLKTFIQQTQTNLIESLTILTIVLMAGLIGLVDDVLGWKRGLRQWQKPLLTIPVAIPLMVINAGVSVMSIPFLGRVDFGILYPLMIIPLAVVGASNGFNMLAGYNGLEAGMGSIILFILGLVSWSSGNFWIAFISFACMSCLLGFLLYNWYPSKVFPGDSLTYATGALIAAIAILGNIEKIAILLFIPYYITFLLKSRSLFRAESFAKVKRDNSFDAPYENCYDVTHVVILFLKKFKKKVFERDVVLFIFLIEILIAAFSLLLL